MEERLFIKFVFCTEIDKIEKFSLFLSNLKLNLPSPIALGAPSAIAFGANVRWTYRALSLLRVSICSPISATASLCFLRRLERDASCWILASSRSLRSLLSSASLFLLSSIWAEVAPPASSNRSPNSSSSRARSLRCFSALARAWRSASTLKIN